MGLFHSPKVVTDGLVFMYDTGNSKSYPGEPTENLITQMAGSTTISYPQTVYISTASETNVLDSSAPGGQYSRFTGNTDSANNQLFSTFNGANIDVRNTTITYSVYLKGSGTCHLTIYADNAGYGTSSTITLTDVWTRYTYTRAVTNYTTNCWVAVRGLLTTTDVYIAAQQAEIKSHATPFVNGTRSATEGLIDRTGNSTIDLSNVSFDSNAQKTFDGTDDIINTGLFSGRNPSTDPFTIEAIVKSDTTSGNRMWLDATSNGTSQRLYCAHAATGTGNPMGIQGSGWSSTSPHDTDYHHYVIVMDGSVATLYNNGEVHSTKSYTSYGIQALNIGGRGGSYPWLGPIPVFKLYDRALTSDEVTKNFNAIRSRFGL